MLRTINGLLWVPGLDNVIDKFKDLAKGDKKYGTGWKSISKFLGSKVIDFDVLLESVPLAWGTLPTPTPVASTAVTSTVASVPTVASTVVTSVPVPTPTIELEERVWDKMKEKVTFINNKNMSKQETINKLEELRELAMMKNNYITVVGKDKVMPIKLGNNNYIYFSNNIAIRKNYIDEFLKD